MNPKRRKRRLPARGKNGRFLKKRAGTRTRKRRTVKRRARRRNPQQTLTRSNPHMARRRTPPRTKSGRFRARRSGGTTATRRRRRYRRNVPAFRMGRPGGMIQAGIETLMGGAGVTAGKIVSRQGIILTRQDPGTPIGIAAQLAIAVAAGVGLRMFNIKGPFADGLVYGAASGAAESVLKLVMPGQAEALLGEYGTGGNYELSAYGTGVAQVQDAGMLAAYQTGM